MRWFTFVLVAGALWLAHYAALANERPPEVRGTVNVVDLGAVGDGETDNTAVFREAMDIVHGEGGGVVEVPAGRFLITGYLEVPERVAIEGVWRAPVRGIPYDGGTTLLTVHGKGDPDAEPFITLNSSSMLSGLTIYYPEQIKENPPHEYPWTVVGKGDNCTIINVTMINPYKAVDFGSNFCGRHYINGLYAQALYRGLYIDQCYDVGRIENIHFWPFWEVATEGPLYDFTWENGVAFTIGRTDGQMGVNLFQIFYGTGFHFVNNGHGGGSGVYTNIYSDITPMAIKVDEVYPMAGISIVNGMIMATVEVGPDNRGPVKFTGTGFWGTPDVTAHQAYLEGEGHVSFVACHFSGWGRDGSDAACIIADNEGVTITSSLFITDRPDHKKVELRPNVKSAIVAMNRMQGGVIIKDNTGDGADVQIGLNTGQ